MKLAKPIIGLTPIICATFSILILCTDPSKPDFNDPVPFSIVLFSDSLGTDTLKNGDTLQVKDTLYFVISANRRQEIDSINISLQDSLGAILYDTTKLFIDTSSTLLYFGSYVLELPGTFTIQLDISMTDSTVFNSFHIMILGLPPVIGNNKAIQTSGNPVLGSPFFMYVVATGSEPLNYQWYKNDTALTEEIQDSMKFTALTHSDTGLYHVTVTNTWGSDISSTYDLGFHAPQWKSDTLYAGVNEAATISITLSDSCSDPDNDLLSFILVDGEPVGDTIVAQDTYIYTPTYNDAGIYEVTIQATDGEFNTSVILKLTVNNVNRRPEFQDSLPKPFYRIDEGALLTIKFEAIDPDDDSVSYILAENTLPRPDSALFNDSQFVWQSLNNDSGVYKVELQATDGLDTAKAPVDIAVGDVNLPPQISIIGYQSGDTAKIKESKTLTFTVEVTDPDTIDTVALLTAINKPSNATYDTTTGAFNYTPDFAVSTGNLNHTFENVTFYAADNGTPPGMDTFVVHITVLDSNTAPKWSINSDNLNATEGTSVSYNFSVQYTGDDEGDIVTFSIPFGTFNADTTVWSWTPDFSSHGDTVCEITASDNHVPPASSKLQLNITVADSTPAVTLSTPANVTYKSVLLSWTQTTDPDFATYKLYYATSPGVTEQSTLAHSITDPFTTTYTVDNLSENTHYYFKVFVHNDNLSISGSNEVDTTTPILGPPVINITYPTITRDSCFVREISPNITGNVVTAAEINSMSATINGVAATVNLQASNDWSLNVSTATKQQWNEIMIHAEDIEGKSSDTTFYMYYMPTLTAPTGLDTSNTTNRSVDLTWNPATYCTRYRLYRSPFSGGPYTCIVDTPANSYMDTILPINTQYWYQVKGYYTASGGFNMQDSTDFSNLSSGKTKNWFFVTFDQGLGEATCVRQTNDSGFIVVGFNYAGGIDAVILKTNESGDSLWANTFGGSGDDKAFSVEQTTDNGFIIAGFTESEGAGGEDVYLIKTDEYGSTAGGGWTKTFGDTADDRGNNVKQTSDGGYILAGYTKSSGMGKQDFYVIKTDASGNTSGGWIKTFGGAEDDVANAVIQTSDNGFAILGESKSFSTRDNEIYQQNEIYLVKTNSIGDTTGTAGWSDTYDGIEPQFIYELTSDEYIIISNYNDEVSVMKVDEFVYERDLFTISNFMSVECADKTTDGYIISGCYWPLKFSTYLLKIDDNFTKQWDATVILNDYDIYGKSIKQTFDGGYIITGYIQDEFGSKWFLLKTDENGYFEH